MVTHLHIRWETRSNSKALNSDVAITMYCVITESQAKPLMVDPTTNLINIVECCLQIVGEISQILMIRSHLGGN